MRLVRITLWRKSKPICFTQPDPPQENLHIQGILHHWLRVYWAWYIINTGNMACFYIRRFHIQIALTLSSTTLKCYVPGRCFDVRTPAWVENCVLELWNGFSEDGVSGNITIPSCVAPHVDYKNWHHVNPFRAKFFGESINIYLHFTSFLHTNKIQVVEIPPRVKQGPAYLPQSISWLLMSWRRKEPGHQQPWYWPS